MAGDVLKAAWGLRQLKRSEVRFIPKEFSESLGPVERSEILEASKILKESEILKGISESLESVPVYRSEILKASEILKEISESLESCPVDRSEIRIAISKSLESSPVDRSEILKAISESLESGPVDRSEILKASETLKEISESLKSEAAAKEKKNKKNKKKKKKEKGKEEEEEEKKKKKKKKKVAYLRRIGDLGLYPNTANIRMLSDLPEELHREGAAREFVSKLSEYLKKKPIDPKRKEEIFCREIQLYLPQFFLRHPYCCAAHVDRGILRKKIKSHKDWDKLPAELRYCFDNKSWFFNENRDGDDYQLLCLRHDREIAFYTDEEQIPGLGCLNWVGNTLEADLQYKDFRNMVFAELQWNDTEVDGVNKAINIRDKYFPCMKDLTIVWVLNDWRNYNLEQEIYWEKINMMCQLWYRVEEKKFQKEEFRKAVRDIYERCDDFLVKDLFNNVQMIKKYIDGSLKKGLNRKAGLLIQEWFEIYKSTPEPKCHEGSYTLFVKEKIRKAIQLGIIQKEDVETFKAGAQLLEEIEQKNPGFFDYMEH